MHMIKCSALALAIGAVGPAAWAAEQLPAAPSSQAQANGLVADSTLNILARNYYNDDNKASGAAQSYVEEWAQGLIGILESGFSQGTIGFGADLQALAGVKLDSGRGRAGTGLLPSDGGNCNS